MSDAKQKDSRIDKIDLTSLGWVYVLDKDGKPIDELCGAWTTKLAVHLESIAPLTTSFGHWRELPFSDSLFEIDTEDLLHMIKFPGDHELTRPYVKTKELNEVLIKLLDYWKNNARTRQD